MTEHDIIEALRVKCAGDAFFDRAKLGPTWGGRGLRIMDAVSLRKSWARPCINGFEVKITRPDFLRDEKWPDYLDVCNRFYWACPKGLIKPDEIDKRCGLIWVNEKGIAHTRTAARYRQIEPPDGLLMYLIMTRLDNPYKGLVDNRTTLKDWLGGKRDDAELGRQVGGRMGKHIAELSSELESLRLNHKEYEETLKQFGIISPWQLAARLSEEPKALVIQALDHALRSLTRARKRLRGTSEQSDV